jgi:DNA gyrase subunit A
MHFVKGPDFPTGGIIYRFREEGKGEDDADAIAQGYSLGKSRLIMQAKAHFEEISRGRTRIIITELPYQTNKTALLERIADLVRDGKIEGISDLRDESRPHGDAHRGRVDAHGRAKRMCWPTSTSIRPCSRPLACRCWRWWTASRACSASSACCSSLSSTARRSSAGAPSSTWQARERAHIVEGLLRALDILDEVIHTIRHSQTVDTARKNLIANFKFSEPQAQAILDMQLRRLAALERKKLQEEFNELQKRIAWLEDLLANPHKDAGVIRDDLVAIRQEYSDARRTQIVDRTRGALTTHRPAARPDGLGEPGQERRRAPPAADRRAKRGDAAPDRQGQPDGAAGTANTRDCSTFLPRRALCTHGRAPDSRRRHE